MPFDCCVVVIVCFFFLGDYNTLSVVKDRGLLTVLSSLPVPLHPSLGLVQTDVEGWTWSWSWMGELKFTSRIWLVMEL